MRERQWYQIKAKAGGEAEVYVYEQIGEDLFGEGVSARNFARELAALDAAHIALHVNSPGGSVFDGQAIYNAIRRHPAQVTSYVDGVAASIASVVALAGDHVVMARNALFMIHDPFAPLLGTAAEHRKMAEILEQVAGTIMGAYREKTGRAAEQIAAAMAAETWYSAQEALEFGFADEVAGPLRVAAAFDLAALGYRHPPAIALEALPAAGRDECAAESPAEGDATAPAAEARAKGRPALSPDFASLYQETVR